MLAAFVFAIALTAYFGFPIKIQANVVGTRYISDNHQNMSPTPKPWLNNAPKIHEQNVEPRPKNIIEIAAMNPLFFDLFHQSKRFFTGTT